MKAHPALKDDLARVIEQSAFKIIEEREKATRLRGRGRGVPRVLARMAGVEARADRAPQRVGGLREGPAASTSAMDVASQFLERYPAHALAPKSLYDERRGLRGDRRLREGRGRSTSGTSASGGARRVASASAAARRRRRRPARRRRARRSRRRRRLYEEKKATDAIINAAVFRAGLRDWARAEAASQAYLETWPKGARRGRASSSPSPISTARRARRRRSCSSSRSTGRSTRSDPDEWLAITQRIAPCARSSATREARPRHVRRGARTTGSGRRAKVKRARPRPSSRRRCTSRSSRTFAAYDRITLNVAPKFLKVAAPGEGEEAPAARERVRPGREAEAGRARHLRALPIGLGYKRFAQSLYDAPIPREIRGQHELVEEYKAQLAQVAEPLEAKAVEGLELADGASRDYGVVNDCSKQATAILVKYKPDEYGPTRRSSRKSRAPGPARAPQGYGILAEVQPVPPPAARAAQLRRAGRVGAPAAPREAGRRARGARRGCDPADPAGARSSATRPLPRKDRKKQSAIDDEDLLP